MTGLEIGFLTLAGMMLLVWSGLHVAVALGLTSFVGVWLLKDDIGVATSMLAQGASDSIASHIFGVVPLFVLMGFLVSIADIGKDAFEVANQGLRRLRGGLGIATVAANAVFAAITGISIASAAVFTRVAVPEMLRYGYKPGFATGVVAGSSVLGMLIPPSLLMILYGFLAEVSVGAMFMAGVVPGLLLAVSYSVGIMVMARFWPSYVGGHAEGDAAGVTLMGSKEMTAKLLPILLLIAAVLGGIYAGFFTATDAGAVGAAGALVIALWKRKLDSKKFWQVLVETGHVTVSVSFLIIGASLYTRMLALSGVPQFLVGEISAAGFGPFAFLAIYILLIVLLGCFIDSSSILLIVLPLMLPIASGFDMNLIWFGIVTIVAVEIGLLTPPFGLSVFVIKSSLNDSTITLRTIFMGALPFAFIMLLTLILLVIFPKLTLALV
ncbi:TRAP transporter large permease subunit [Ferrovibrio terrae]|uniref:TRAP transporter large permease protein n=1 Tax=Ferrovibrio terrae TaxID=2594003 RepID=A0A516H2R4_9PROT|nr:TRAP transporter large permease subunit [Ferrovibrio terrae]QDO98064.1 TRAP transporter large permease subunit [Ferrovibrio terrae]